MSNNKPDIIKAAAIILRSKKLLIARRKEIPEWISVGGKPNPGESLEAALVREVKEETGMEVTGKPEIFHISDVEPAAGRPGTTVQITSYLVEAQGEPRSNPEDKIVEFHWLSREEYTGRNFPLGSILQDYVVPKLLAAGLM